MEKTKHTPGPWIYKTDGFCITIGNESTRHEYLAHDYCVAVIHDNSLQAEANAHAITALPDLLEACIEALHAFEQHSPAIHPNVRRHLEAAIAKAEGEKP